MKKEFNISESDSECRLWWKKEGFNRGGEIQVNVEDLDKTLYEAGLARITGKVLY